MTDEILTQDGETTELSKPDDFGKGMAFLNPSEMPDLDAAEVGFNIQPEYHEFINAGDTLRAVFNGISHIMTKDQAHPGQYKQIPAVVLQNKDGVKLNAGASLVSQFERLMPGTAVQITYKGTEKTKSGNNVKTYEIRLLNVPRANVPVTSAPAIPAQVSKPEYKNMNRKDEYWKMVNQVRLTNEEGNDHLKEFNYDFAAALEALTPGFIV